MSDRALPLISALLECTADVGSTRMLVRKIAETLARWFLLERVELRAASPCVTAVLVDGEWRIEEQVPDPSATELAPGLAIVSASRLPDHFARPEVREALGHVVAAATRHLDVIKRVAQVSRRAYVENRELRSDLDRLEQRGQGGIIARSPAMRAALTRAALVARHPTTVLLSGESGTGKEVFAKEIHRLSPRARRPMIQLNCGAIPESLVESELFGHERGAFTGAERAHIGAFERAHRGTLLLDEIGELPLPAQAKLLRVLQERRLRRMGGETEIDVDVRVIAATNRRLATMVDDGTFREDLFYRLDVFTIQLPPLRERRGDLGPLVAVLVDELAQKLRLPAPSLSAATLARLDKHPWPGNVRELMNTLETAMILGGGDGLALPAEFSRTAKSSRGAPRFESAVRVAIEEALRATRGKVYGADGAAARLGLKPGTLQSKMKKLGVERRDFA